MWQAWQWSSRARGTSSTKLHPELAAFLTRHSPLAGEEALWGGGSIRLQIRCYLGLEIPPLDYVTSVRSIVFKKESVLVMRNMDDTHIYPGGRREGNESLDGTLQREVLEETGWEVADVSRLGFIHFEHLTPRPDGYLYPYPHFMHIICMAKASRFIQGARLEDDYELDAAFRPITEVQELTLSPCQHVFLRAALELRA
jgi:ADP-ribose pyrophosphatase YjhB (NUDIX family)